MPHLHAPLRPHQRRPSRQRGVATLVVVMVLFFIISLVAAYTSRNLIFEQRTSANQYRSTQAFEAADAGVEWTLAMLNGGRINQFCLPSTDPADNTFRDRYLSAAGLDQSAVNADGSITLRTRSTGEPLMPACVFDAATRSWKCNCPSNDVAAVPAIGGSEAKPMFRIRFEFVTQTAGTPPVTTVVRPDVVRVVSAGCTRPDDACLSATPAAPAGDAMAIVSALVTLKSGLTTPPAAAISARGNLAAGAPDALRVVNADPGSNGLTLDLGGVVASGSTQLSSLPGTPGSASVVDNDPALQLSPAPPLTPEDAMFASVFGMWPEMYRQQPAAVVVDCTGAGGCASSMVNAIAGDNPGRPLWLNGSLTLNSDIGSADRPVMVVVTGSATLASGTFYGVLYSRAEDWDRGTGSATLRGAVIAESNLVGSGSQLVVYDADVLNRVRSRIGSFVRVPGGWKDF